MAIVTDSEGFGIEWLEDPAGGVRVYFPSGRDDSEKLLYDALARARSVLRPTEYRLFTEVAGAVEVWPADASVLEHMVLSEETRE